MGPFAAETVEQLLRRDPTVASCAVVPVDSGTGELRLVAYVVAAAGAAGEEVRRQLELEHVARYSEVYDAVYGEQRLTGDVDGLSLRVWINSYTGEPMPRAEILEDVENMRRRILSLSPRRALEIGCGTGLLLFMIAPHCERYVATDSSGQGLRLLRQQLASRIPPPAAGRALPSSSSRFFTARAPPVRHRDHQRRGDLFPFGALSQRRAASGCRDAGTGRDHLPRRCAQPCPAAPVSHLGGVGTSC